jgi:hypothetical protein
VACCAALTLLFSWIYRAVGWALPHRDDEFAPAAVWPPPSTELSAAPERRVRSRQPHDSVARACVVVGIAWFVAGVLAMHVFGALDPIRSESADIVFHASGLWLATAGLAIRFVPRHALRSAA